MAKIQVRMDERTAEVVIAALGVVEEEEYPLAMVAEAKATRVWLTYLLSRHRQREAAKVA